MCGIWRRDEVLAKNSDSVLISSANLTQYALNLNMEMGLRVKDKTLAEKIVRHFELLAQRGILG